MARLSIDFPSIAAIFSPECFSFSSGNGSQSHGLKLPVKNLLGRPLVKLRQSLPSYFTALVLLKCYIDFRRGSILSLRNFGQKALYIELAGECHDLAPMSRSSQFPNVQKRCADSISSFVVIQRQKQNANRLPIHNVKVYFPCLLTTQVLRNLPSLSLEGAVTVEQPVRSTIHDTTQQFSTLVLRAGRTSLPSLRVQDFSTPLTQKAFTAGLFDATTTSNLGSSFGQTKVRLEVRSASPEQYGGDFNAEKEWHKHMPTPWDVMQLSPAQALTISCQSCGVQIASSDLRDTYGQSFVISEPWQD